jgi:hypothetical protein
MALGFTEGYSILLHVINMQKVTTYSSNLYLLYQPTLLASLVGGAAMTWEVVAYMTDRTCQTLG